LPDLLPVRAAQFAEACIEGMQAVQVESLQVCVVLAQAIVPSLAAAVQLAAGDEGFQLALQVVVQVAVFEAVEVVQVGGRPLRLGEVGDEEIDVLKRVGRVRVGKRLMRVAVVQREAGGGLFGAELVGADQPLLCLFGGRSFARIGLPRKL